MITLFLCICGGIWVLSLLFGNKPQGLPIEGMMMGLIEAQKQIEAMEKIRASRNI